MEIRRNSVIRFRFRFNKINYIWLAIVAVTAFVLWYVTGFSLMTLLVFLPVYCLIGGLRIRCKAKTRAILAAVWIIFAAWFTMISMQMLLLNEELFAKTKDSKLQWNFLIALAVYLVVLTILDDTALVCTIVHSSLMTLAFADYFVYSFRGNELTFADLRSAGTGLSVAANYQFTMEAKCGRILLITILFLTLSWKMRYSYSHKVGYRLPCLLAVCLAMMFVGWQTKDVNTETWEMKGTYRNGFLLNFCLQIRDSFVPEPEGYSVEAIEELEQTYATEQEMETETRKPMIIVIMNESFADLRVIGRLRCNTDLTPFLDSLQDNVIRGYALSSVYSAKTPNSEWEFMTGNSMAFMPQGSVVYQQFISDEPTSMVSYLSNLGYTCVAMHPYYETGWSRNSIYPTMGFDEMRFIDDFDQTQLLRKYITDEEFYRRIIERCEYSPEKEDLFIMGITMQNHGGYGEEYDNMEQYVYKYGVSWTNVNQYLQLLHESDMALEKFIHYFEQVNYPVEIVFFGDHQPGLNSAFYRQLNGKGLSGLTLKEMEDLYTVPFFIWTNYESETEEIELTSLNYLSTLALERAGIAPTGYNQFLAEMMKRIPAINSQAYYSQADQCFKYLDDAAGEEAEWINNYHMLQYNNMFDISHRSDAMFPYLDYADLLTGGIK